MTNSLVVTIPDHPSFYSLYSDGLLSGKTYVKETGSTLISYNEHAVVILYYTYPTHREACVIRNTCPGPVLLPGLSKKVSLLFNVQASRVDKLRRAVGFLHAHALRPFSRNDGFYIRLSFLLSQKGPLSYPALRHLASDPAAGDMPPLPGR